MRVRVPPHAQCHPELLSSVPVVTGRGQIPLPISVSVAERHRREPAKLFTRVRACYTPRMKTCRSCREELDESEYYSYDAARNKLRNDCKKCVSLANSRRRSSLVGPSCKGCGTATARRESEYCRPCWRDEKERLAEFTPPKFRLDKHGYMVGSKTVNGRRRDLSEHRWVMEKLLGRPLLKGESVHHVNGVRHDNRPENLELWVTWQPSGQRPEDLVKWAREILERYD